MRRALGGLVVLCALVIALASAPLESRARSDALVSVLTETQQLSNSDFTTLCAWARNGASAPFSTYFQPQRTQADILALGDKDRQAVLLWLQGSGRSALYARGASDYQIGPRRAPADTPSGTPTPGAWRQIPLASATLDGDVQGHVQILGGFAAVKADGTAAIVCVSFKNIAPVTANRILFEFPLLDRSGNPLGNLTLDRTGEFSTGVAIATYDGFAIWQQGGIGPRGYADNCSQRTFPTAAVPLLQARTASYRVMRVEYDSGPPWMPGVP